MKVCYVCRKEKESTNFFQCKSRPDGLQTMCKECRRYYEREYRKTHREILSARTKAWRSTNREKFNKQAVDRRKANIEKMRDYGRRWYAAHAEHLLARTKELRLLNREKYLAANRARYLVNQEKEKTKQTLWRNENREKMRASWNLWQRNNRHKVCANVMKRNAGKFQATPKWANPFFIEEIYNLAQLRTKATGIKWHVDHIVPLKSKTVCGLHVEHNLQVIPAARNISKGNRHWPDMPQEIIV